MASQSDPDWPKADPDKEDTPVYDQIVAEREEHK